MAGPYKEISVTKYRFLGISLYAVLLSLFIAPGRHVIKTVTGDFNNAHISIFESSFNPTSIKVEYCLNLYEAEEIVLSSAEKRSEVFELYNSLSFQDTSLPMDFPRFIIYFVDEDREVIEWYLDYAGLTAGSEFGLGNKQILGDKNIYDILCGICLD